MIYHLSMGIDTAAFQPRKTNTEAPKTFSDAVTEIGLNRRAVNLLSYMFPESGGDPKISLGVLRNKFPTIQLLQDGLTQGVLDKIGVARNPQHSDQEHRSVVAEKQRLYQREAVALIVEALRPIYEHFPTPGDLERKNTLDARSKIIMEFTSYFNQDYPNISQEYASGRSLQDIFYDRFYSKDASQKQFEAGSYQARAIKERYAKLLEKNVREAEASVKGKNIIQIPDTYWQYYYVGGGVGKSKMGRIYLNLHPLDTPFVFRRALELFTNNGLSIETKVPLHMHDSALNRADKMVIYFKDEQDAQVMQVLEQLYRANSNTFQDSIPRFTAQLRDSAGSSLPGLGFGEEPLSKESFGEVRSAILAEVTQIAGQRRLKIDDPRFPFEQLFISACQKRGVDPDSPAFNASSGQFREIRRRVTI